MTAISRPAGHSHGFHGCRGSPCIAPDRTDGPPGGGLRPPSGQAKIHKHKQPPLPCRLCLRTFACPTARSAAGRPAVAVLNIARRWQDRALRSDQRAAPSTMRSPSTLKRWLANSRRTTLASSANIQRRTARRRTPDSSKRRSLVIPPMPPLFQVANVPSITVGFREQLLKSSARQ